VLLTRYITLKSLKSRPLRVIFSAAGIVLGVAGLLAIYIINDAALASISRVLQSTSGRVNLSILPSGNQQGFSVETLDVVSRISGIKAVLPLVNAQTLLADDLPPDQIELNFFGTSAGGLLLNGVDPELELLARDYAITQGRFLDPVTRDLEVVLVDTFASEKSLTVGKMIEIVTPNGREKVKLVGVIAREGPGLTNNGNFGVLSVQTAQKLFNRNDELDQIDLLTSKTAVDAVEDVQAQVQSRLGSAYSVIFPASQGQRQTQMLTNYQIGLNMMSGIALFVGAFLIYNAFAMTIIERTREFGMLRIIGMTRRQIISQMLIEALLLGLVGSSIGVGLGILLSRSLAQVMSSFLGVELAGISIPVAAVIISFSMGLVATLLAAAMPAVQAGRISPMAALTIRASANEGWIIKHGWKPGLVLLVVAAVVLVWNPFASDPRFTLGSMTVFALFTGATLVIPATIDAWERAARPLMRLFYGASGVLGSRNIQRVRLRTTLTVAALMVGVSMVLVVESMTASFSSDLVRWINAYIGGDLYIASSIPLRSDMVRRIQAVPGVAAVTPIRYLAAEWRLPDGDQESLSVMAIDPASYVRVTSFVFSDDDSDQRAAVEALAAGGNVFISSVLAEKNGLSAGDSIEIKTSQGFRDFNIAAVVVDFYNQGLVVKMSWSDMRRYFKQNDANTFLVSINDMVSTNSVQETIDKLYGKRYQLILESNEKIRSRIFVLIDQAFFMFDMLAIISVVVASLGVVNTLTINVIERTREIGMLRATGMLRGQIIRMVMAEAGLMGIVGGLLGLGFGVLLARIFLFGMAVMSGYKLDFIVPANGIITGLAIAMVVSQVAAYFPGRRAARTNILKAIHYE